LRGEGRREVTDHIGFGDTGEVVKRVTPGPFRSVKGKGVENGSHCQKAGEVSDESPDQAKAIGRVKSWRAKKAMIYGKEDNTMSKLFNRQRGVVVPTEKFPKRGKIEKEKDRKRAEEKNSLVGAQKCWKKKRMRNETGKKIKGGAPKPLGTGELETSGGKGVFTCGPGGVVV